MQVAAKFFVRVPGKWSKGIPSARPLEREELSVAVGEVGRICILKPSRKSPHPNAAFKSVMHYFPLTPCNITLLCVCPRRMTYMHPGKSHEHNYIQKFIKSYMRLSY